MQATPSPPAPSPLTAMRRAAALGAGAVGCALLAAVLAARAAERAAVGRDRLADPQAAVAVVGVDGLVEMGALAAGLVLSAWFSVSLCAAAACATVRLLGRRWTAGERLVARYAPGVVRRALVLSAGAGLALAGAGLPAVAAVDDAGAPAELGWSATTAMAPRAASVQSPAEPAPAPAADTARTPEPTPGADMPPTSDPAAGADTPPTSDPAPGADTPPTSDPAPGADTPPTSDPTPGADTSPAPVPEPSGGGSPAPAPVFVTVRPGDTLWAIAAAHLPAGADASDIAAAWPAWYAVNARVVGDDPDLIRPGQRLAPPATAPAPTGAAR